MIHGCHARNPKLERCIFRDCSCSSLIFYVLVLKQSIDTECALSVYPDDDVGLSENPFLRVLNTEMNKNLCGEVIDVEAGRNGWFDLNRGEPGFPGTVPCLVTLAVPCAELLQVEGAPDVPEPGVVCSLSVR